VRKKYNLLKTIACEPFLTEAQNAFTTAVVECRKQHLIQAGVDIILA
jgi:hypothetical protein